MSVLLYGSSAQTLTKELTKKLNGPYTQLLSVAKGVLCQQHMTSIELSKELQKIVVVTEQKMKWSGLFWRNKEEFI